MLSMLLPMTLALGPVAQAMSLPEAVQGALQTAPALDVAGARVAEAEAVVAQAVAGQLPTVTLTAGVAVQNQIEYSFIDQLPSTLQALIDPNDVEPILVQPGRVLQGGASVSQPLLVPRLGAARRASRAGLRVAEAESEATAQQITTLVTNAWYASSQAGALVVDAEAGVALAEHLLDRGAALVSHGVATTDQLLPFQRARSSARANLLMARQAQQLADGVLEVICGRGGGADAAVLPSEPVPLQQVLSAISRPDLDAAALRVQAAQAAVALERSARLPTLAASGAVGVITPVPGFGDPLNWRVGVGAQVPVFQAGQVSRRIDAASARVSMARAAEATLRQQAELEVRRAHGTLQLSLVTLTEREDAVGYAQQAVAAAEKRLGGGSGSLLAVQQAQAELAAARAQLTVSRSQAALAQSALWLAAVGGVEPAGT